MNESSVVAALACGDNLRFAGACDRRPRVLGRVPEASSSDIQECAAAIARISRTQGFEYRIAVGTVILARLFPISKNEPSIRHIAAHSSFLRLARALEGGMSRSDLYRCAMLSHVHGKLPFISSVAHFTVSHIEAVDGTSLEDQEILLRRAAAERWSVRQLRRAKAELTPASPAARRRATTLAIRRATSMQAAVLEELAAARSLIAKLEDGEHSSACVASLLNQVQGLIDACDRCLEQVGIATLAPVSPASAGPSKQHPAQGTLCAVVVEASGARGREQQRPWAATPLDAAEACPPRGAQSPRGEAG